jgi:regulator of replication initiation timing
MSEYEELSNKLQKLLAKHKEIREENAKLKVENDFLRKQNSSNMQKAATRAASRKDIDNSITKIEKMLKKIESLKQF